ncbi:hypothetical protein CI088_15785 [Enterococcus plantarum]|uniref:Uncharacterized protein n=1 Tax=Enterococcus plantarum TaxID=1077675 RepID=A0A2W3YQ74_9ENTE|nr:hypothetical protein [Enterococcus plantarum]PZL70108.1 hypothetical protein CI088_15785 [Enterococcus plantarum]
MTAKTTIDDLIFEIECMAPAGETNGIPYLRLGKADLLHKLNAIKGQSDHQPDLNIKNNNNNPTPWSQIMTDHQPTFEVGEYYASNDGDVYKITDQEKTLISVKLYSKSSDRFLNITIPSHDPQDKPATAEKIATFKRAEQFAAKGRKLDEFRVGDMCKTVDGYMYTIGTDYIAKVSKDESATLIQTAEELQEVENNE